MGLFDWLTGKSRKPYTGDTSNPGASDLDEEFDQLLAEMESGQSMGPKRPQLYVFQHFVLPEAAFTNHPKLMAELSGKYSPLPFSYFRSKAELRCVDVGYLTFDQINSEEAMDAESELFRSVAVHTRRRDGYSVHIVTMPEPKSRTEALFVAIVHKDDEQHVHMTPSPSTRYFTLEHSPGSPRHLFCEWTRDGSHANYGEGPDPQLEPFATWVFDFVLAS